MHYVSHANRGMIFEGIIKSALEVYQIKGEAVVTKQNTKFMPLRNTKGVVVSCKVDEKATCDFMGRYGNIPVAFEAKHTQDTMIRFNVVQNHQQAFLDAFSSNNAGIAFVAVSFRLERFFAIPWAYWKANLEMCNATKARKKEKVLVPLAIWKAEAWTTGKASITEDEIPAEWEIKPRAPYVLPILDVVQKYCIKHTESEQKPSI